MYNLLPLRHVQLLGRPRQSERLGPFQHRFFRIHLLDGRNLVRRKKLLRAAAAGSTSAVITPVNFSHAQILSDKLGRDPVPAIFLVAALTFVRGW